MSVCIVSFSSRKNGNCTQISNYIGSMFKDAVCYNFSNFNITGCGNCTYQCFANSKACPYARDKEHEILETISKSEMAIFIVPNYCDYPCSNYFVFNERSLNYLQNNEQMSSAYMKVPKKFIVISNTNRSNFNSIFAYQTFEERKILFLSSKKYGKKSTDGDLITSDKVIEEVKRFVLG